MGFRTTYRGLPVEVDTIDDLDRLAERARARNGNQPQAAVSVPEPEQPDWSITGFVSALPENARNGLRVLLENGGRMRDAEYCRALGFADNGVLGGRVTSPIARAANRNGIEPERIIGRTLVSTDPTAYDYWIPEGAREAIGQALEAI